MTDSSESNKVPYGNLGSKVMTTFRKNVLVGLSTIVKGLIGVSMGAVIKQEKTPYGSDGDDADSPPHPHHSSSPSFFFRHHVAYGRLGMELFHGQAHCPISVSFPPVPGRGINN